MHIVVIPSWYKSERHPYSGTFFEEQARALMSGGNKVRIFYPCFYPFSQLFKAKPQYEPDWNDNGLITRATVIQGYIPRSQRLNNRYMQWQSDKMFSEYIEKDGRPDVIHAHSVYDAGIIGLSLSEKFNIPLVITEHLTHFTDSLAGNTFKIEVARKVLQRSSQSIAVSNRFKRDLERELSLDTNILKVVYNMVANLFYDTFQPRIWHKEEDFVFFTNSFLHSRKNHTLQFDAMKKLVDKNYMVKLVVGGAGDQEKYLKDYVIRLGLEKQITFLGELSRIRVKEEIDKSHAFLLSSKFESFGVVLIESIISGRPAISTDSGGPSEIINAGNGYLVPSLDSTEYAQAMEKMIHNYSLFNQEKMREACHAQFSETTISHQLMEIYKDVIRKFNMEGSIQNKISLRRHAAALSSWLFFLE
jgi:glycosyltransferase involved in cell wall biosynthesis